MTYQEFYHQMLGKAVDIDGYYGAQCWDGAMYYLQKLGYKAISCTTSGYVKDIWNNRKTNGILNYCNEVTVMQPGDIAVFREVAGWTPYSHIAIFHSDIDGKYGWFFGQNQGGYKGSFNLCKLPYYCTFDTAFRPKCFATSQKPSNANTTTKEPIDQILNVGSYVTSVPMKIGNQGLKAINGQTCAYLAELGGWFPIDYVSEYDSSDGNKDNYLANTNARVYVDRCRVDSVNVKSNLVQIHGIWVNPTPLIEVA